MYGEDDKAKGRSMDIRPSADAEATERHDLIRLHPETGRKSMFGCAGYIVGIAGMEQEEGWDLVTDLCRWQTRPGVSVPARMGARHAADVGQSLPAAHGDRRLCRARSLAAPHNNWRDVKNFAEMRFARTLLPKRAKKACMGGKYGRHSAVDRRGSS
jgi:hypothetical protein